MTELEGTIDYRVTGFGIIRPKKKNFPALVTFELTLEPLSPEQNIEKKQLKLIVSLKDIKCIGVSPEIAAKINHFLNMGESNSDWWREMLILNNDLSKRIYHHNVKIRIL